MAVRISCGLVLLFAVKALVQPPAKSEQVQVLGCFGGSKPNSTRCQDGKCFYRCVHPNSNSTELACKEQETLHMVGVSAGGISWACQDLIRPELEYDHLYSDVGDFACQLSAACRVGEGGTGCFLVSRLPKRLESLHEDLLQSAREFFSLPPDQKEQLDYHLSPEFRGFMRQGAENTAGAVDEREQIEFGREESRPVRSREEPHTLYNRLRGPNLWPEQPTSLRPLMTSWLAEMEELSRQLTRALAVSLGLTETGLDAYFREPHVQAKLVHYPTPAKDAEGGLLGVGPHSDSGFLTLLLQDSSGGLDFLDASGGWVEATPQPASVVCNLGEVVQLITGGRYPATVHRVRRPTVAGRLSAPFFWNPSLDVEVQPLDLAGKVPSLTGRPEEAQNRMLQRWPR
ncbi:DIN11 [Symbiodinium sp. CCMP2592]|nr:DIN11 [Symbiodinium sp. CCMP2592]